MIVFADESSRGAADPVARVLLKVECHPGQAQSIKDFLAGVQAKAGVYSVSVEDAVVEAEIFVRAEPDVPTELQGEVHAEQSIQPTSGPSEEVAVGDGEATPVGESVDVGAGEVGELAGSPGQDAEGPLGGDAAGEVFAEERGAVEPKE